MSDATARLTAALADRYRIERRLGEGGMATVYLAADVKHDRKVALKVLRPELAAVLGAERFVQEIKTTAALQHPHILPLFDSGEADGFLYYVMPFIEGETLREKLNREKQLGIDEAVQLTTDVAQALEAAHEQGVIHRDIKPENVLLHKGRALVADFGIALAVSAAAGGRMTETGLSLGTPHYMSPEQATAEKDISARSDVYSLGAVFYEMLTGEPPHMGNSAQQIIMKIVTDTPRAVTDLRKSVPPNVSAAVAKALEKLAADRFDSAAKFAEALNDPHFAVTHTAMGRDAVAAPLQSRALALAGWGVAAGLTIAIGWLVLRPAPTVTAPIPIRLTLDMVDTDDLRLGEIVVSPDGSVFALPTFVGIYIRPAGAASFRLLPNTGLAITPAFSPDGRSLVFVREGVLTKIAIEGGSASSILRSNTLIASNPHWGATGTIEFQSEGRLYRVSEAGGEPELLGGGIFGRRPTELPDGSGVLFSAPEGIKLFEFGADSARLIVPDGTDAVYVATGHLVYGHAREGGLFAVPFDLRARAVTGTPVPVMDDVSIIGDNAYYAVSQTGTLVYPTDPLLRTVGATRQLLLLDLRGRIDTIPLSPRTFNWPRFSPDGRWLSFNTGTGRIEQRMLYLYDLETGATTQITSEGGTHAAAWSPDGKRFVFSSERDGTVAEDLFVMPIDGSAPATHILQHPGDEHAMAWPTEDRIVFSADGDEDLLMVDPSARERKATPYLNAEWAETELSVSPDGAFAAYESNESGRAEIYVRHFPEAQDRRRVSASGGRAPRWAPDGRSVYYWSLTRDTLFAAPVEPRSQSAGRREVVAVIPRLIPGWDVDRVTGRAVVLQVAEETADVTQKLMVVVNWFEELKARVGN